MHAFMNLYAWPSARAVGALSLGALRSELQFCTDSYGRGAKWLLWFPDALVANSEKAVREIVQKGIVAASKAHILPNCVETQDYRPTRKLSYAKTVEAVFLARLLPSKRPDLFLRALSLARRKMLALKGVVLGDGPELERMKRLASDLSLTPDGVHFVGYCADPIPWLTRSDMMVFCSDSEGSPNAILEALAARLPVITTPAGDADVIVKRSGSGYIVPFGDAGAIAEQMVLLAGSDELRQAFGCAGRAFVEAAYSSEKLGDKLFAIYRAAAKEARNGIVLGALSAVETVWSGAD
jgi:glycosyltransferase involved in cell wall biosynthesis